MSNQQDMSLEAVFHRLIKTKVGPRTQGHMMGALREAMAIAQPPAIPKSECPNCLGDALFGCTECEPDAQHQGEPLAWCAWNVSDGMPPVLYVTSKHPKEQELDPWVQKGRRVIATTPLYTHADAGEVERLREDRRLLNALCDERFSEISGLRTQLARQKRRYDGLHQDMETIAARKTPRSLPVAEFSAAAIAEALSASAEPSAPTARQAQALEDEKRLGIERLPKEPSAPVEREAVEVEAYLVRNKEVPKHRGVRLFVDPSCYDANTVTLPLMTVAQHERIVAALERKP